MEIAVGVDVSNTSNSSHRLISEITNSDDFQTAICESQATSPSRNPDSSFVSALSGLPSSSKSNGIFASDEIDQLERPVFGGECVKRVDVSGKEWVKRVDVSDGKCVKHVDVSDGECAKDVDISDGECVKRFDASHGVCVKHVDVSNVECVNKVDNANADSGEGSQYVVQPTTDNRNDFCELPPRLDLVRKLSDLGRWNSDVSRRLSSYSSAPDPDGVTRCDVVVSPEGANSHCDIPSLHDSDHCGRIGTDRENISVNNSNDGSSDQRVSDRGVSSHCNISPITAVYNEPRLDTSAAIGQDVSQSNSVLLHSDASSSIAPDASQNSHILSRSGGSVTRSNCSELYYNRRDGNICVVCNSLIVEFESMDLNYHCRCASVSTVHSSCVRRMIARYAMWGDPVACVRCGYVYHYRSLSLCETGPLRVLRRMIGLDPYLPIHIAALILLFLAVVVGGRHLLNEFVAVRSVHMDRSPMPSMYFCGTLYFILTMATLFSVVCFAIVHTVLFVFIPIYQISTRVYLSTSAN